MDELNDLGIVIVSLSGVKNKYMPNLQEICQLNGYISEQANWNLAINGEFAVVLKGGKKYLLRKLHKPKKPRDDIDSYLYYAMKKEFDEFFSSLLGTIMIFKGIGANICAPVDAFVCGYSIYYVIPYFDWEQTKPVCTSGLAFDEKIYIMKSICSIINRVHEMGVVHGSLDGHYNILFSYSAIKKPIVTICDFADSWLSGYPTSPDLAPAVTVYSSPEYLQYKHGHVDVAKTLTSAVDVFALGMIFHELWSGESIKCDYWQLGDAILEGISYQLNENLPSWMKELICEMLKQLPEERPTLREAFDILNQHSKHFTQLVV